MDIIIGIVLVSGLLISLMVLAGFLCRNFYQNGVHDERMRVLGIIHSLPQEYAGEERLYVIHYIIEKMKGEE